MENNISIIKAIERSIFFLLLVFRYGIASFEFEAFDARADSLGGATITLGGCRNNRFW